MTAVPSYFTDFLSNIRLTPEQRDSCEEKWHDLRDLLYFITLIIAWLAATAVVVDLKKAA